MSKLLIAQTDIYLTPDEIELFRIGPVTISMTYISILIAMAVLLILSWLATRKISSGRKISRWQNMMEVAVYYIKEQIREVAQQNPEPYLPFVGTLFLYILVSNILSVVPGFMPATQSITATAALAICVFFAVPFFGISKRGFKSYIKNYIQPTPLMLPFNLIGEVSRTLALAVRLFGNVMSGGLIVSILLTVMPLFVPVLMQVLGLMFGVIQAYVFAVLATVYIASAAKVQDEQVEKHAEKTK